VGNTVAEGSLKGEPWYEVFGNQKRYSGVFSEVKSDSLFQPPRGTQEKLLLSPRIPSNVLGTLSATAQIGPRADAMTPVPLTSFSPYRKLSSEARPEG
jgi:hypothetical protein